VVNGAFSAKGPHNHFVADCVCRGVVPVVGAFYFFVRVFRKLFLSAKS
jgi:hypothetical protein